MIPEQHENEVVSTVAGERVELSIEAGAMAHIMNVLTNLYSDEELACIREYATNALDSHIAAGQTRPIEVTLPTDLRPILTIRDFGLGLAAEEIRDIYSQYGASTKRGSNDAVGMLGLGCKSALAYVDQFTLVAIKDGERIVVNVARDETGTASMTILEPEPTDDHAGVEVQIPAKRFNSFEDKAGEFFKWWEPGTVLVNGEPPEPVEETWRIDDEFSIVTKNGYERKLRIVMGNVSYPISYEYEHESKILAALPDTKQIVARVPIGMVSFTPSRESLQEHPQTKAALDQILATFETACAHAIKSQIAGAQSKPEAAKRLLAAREALGPKNVPATTYAGEIIPTVISAEDLPGEGVPDRYGIRHKLWSNRGGHGGARAAAGQITLDDAAKNPWVLNYRNQTWSKTQRRKLNRYMEEHNLHAEPGKTTVYIATAAAVPLPEWIDGNVVAIDWEAVREWKDPKTTSEGGTGVTKYAGTYETYWTVEGRVRRNAKRPADELPKGGRNLYYCGYDGWDYARTLGAKAVVVEVPPHREAKFRRLFPHARLASNVLRSAARRWWDRLDEDAALAVVISAAGHADDFAKLDPAQIDDPVLSEAITAVRRWDADKTLRGQYERFTSYLSLYDESAAVEVELEKFSDRYPLAEDVCAMTPKHYEHLTLYVNAAYAAEKR